MASKKQAKAEDAELEALKKLAESPSPAAVRIAAGGDWVKADNPSPEEQRAESARTDAIRRLQNQ